jgi:SPP1 family predicted phage head-tail adaptor
MTMAAASPKAGPEVAELSAALRPVGGGESVEADRLAGRVTHEIGLRYRHGVQPVMRFRKGARLFHILTVIDVEERKSWLTCLCEEREL